MTDELDHSARQVRLGDRDDSTVHHVHASFQDPSGAAYLTCCDEVLVEADGAILTTRGATCTACWKAE